ncbi:MAG: glycosyltransferase, partial [Gemmatimonadetes bacterium]|nr:glycosyltransferase [Gemmatimonadota bacterium]
SSVFLTMSSASSVLTSLFVRRESIAMVKFTRLLYVVNDAAFFLSHRLALALAAAKAGYEVHVATPEARAAEEIRNAGLAFHPVAFSRRGTNPLEDLQSLRSLYRLYRSLRPDLVHFHHLTHLSLRLPTIAKNRGLPVAFTLHDYWLFCQLGQLLTIDLKRCAGPRPGQCSRCVSPQSGQPSRPVGSR